MLIPGRPLLTLRLNIFSVYDYFSSHQDPQLKFVRLRPQQLETTYIWPITMPLGGLGAGGLTCLASMEETGYTVCCRDVRATAHR